MKLVRVGPVWERCGIDRAFAAVFGEATLRRVHGPSLRAEPWAGDRRTLRFDVEVSGIPAEIRRFFCGSRMRVRARQTLTKDQTAEGAVTWTVRSAMRMHFLGAELFSVKPVFRLVADAQGREGVEFSGSVEHRARLPPPLKGLAEELMARHTEQELARYTVEARAAFAAAGPASERSTPAS
jgi:hypothetical protein